MKTQETPDLIKQINKTRIYFSEMLLGLVGTILHSVGEVTTYFQNPVTHIGLASSLLAMAGGVIGYRSSVKKEQVALNQSFKESVHYIASEIEKKNLSFVVISTRIC